MTLIASNETCSETTDSVGGFPVPNLAHRLNWLRAAVLGANDGIVSTAGLVVGVAAATNSTSTIFTAGLAGLIAGAVSMALGEYVSVSAQRDTERLIHSKESHLGADETSNPWQAALSSAISFTLGAVLPLVAILVPPAAFRVPVVFVAVIVALALTGTISAALGGVSKPRAVLRVVIGGAVAMLVTYGIGQLVGTPM